MNEKKRSVYDVDVMDLPTLRLMNGEGANPLTDEQEKTSRSLIVDYREKKGTVKRIIAHLEED